MSVQKLAFRAHANLRPALRPLGWPVVASALLGSLACGTAERVDVAGPAAPGGVTGSNVSFGGAQDMGFFRSELELGRVPPPEALDAAGFFAEHHTELPPPSCGQRVCVQPMLAVLGNLMDGSNCTMLQVALSSPLVADPSERPPLDLSVVVDVSGSMSGQKMHFVRRGLSTLLDGLADGDRFALVTYADGAEQLVAMTEVAGRRAELRRSIESLEAGGGTNLHAGLSAGYQSVVDDLDLARSNRVILLSDGNPTTGIVAESEILAMSRAFNSEGIGLTTIGLGTDFNVELMRGLSQQVDGNFYFLEDAGAVDEVFEEELSFFSVPVALDLRLQVTAGDQYEFGRALGAPAWEDRLEGGVLELPSVFLAHRQAHEDVTADGGRRGGGSSLLLELNPRDGSPEVTEPLVAKLDLSFRDPMSDAIETESVFVKLPFPSDVTPEQGHFDAPDPAVVQKSFVMLNVYVGLEQATLAFHRRNASAETLTSLDALMAAVQDYNEEVGDVDIAADLELLRRLRENLSSSGVGEPVPRQWDNPWPVD